MPSTTGVDGKHNTHKLQENAIEYESIERVNELLNREISLFRPTIVVETARIEISGSVCQFTAERDALGASEASLPLLYLNLKKELNSAPSHYCCRHRVDRNFRPILIFTLKEKLWAHLKYRVHGTKFGSTSHAHVKSTQTNPNPAKIKFCPNPP